MKTPEKIKKGLSTCTQSGDCPNCPYETDCKEHAESGDNLWLGEPAMADALAYIQQLERERDAAVADIKQIVQDPFGVSGCDFCEFGYNEEECEKRNCCVNRADFEWRGLWIEVE